MANEVEEEVTTGFPEARRGWDAQVQYDREAGAVDDIARTFQARMPNYVPGTRESTNVEDRRGLPPDGLDREGLRGVLPVAELTNPRPSVPMDSWNTTIHYAKGFMEDVNDTLANLLNPQPLPEIDPGSEDAYGRALLAQRAQGRAVANVATTLAGAGSLAAVRAPYGRLGALGGRGAPPPREVSFQLKTEKGEDFSIVRDPQSPRDWSFVKDGKMVGEFAVLPDPAGNGMYNIDGLLSSAPRGTGLSRPVYKHFDEAFNQIGMRLVPSESLTQASYNNWLKMNPTMVQKGAYKKVETPEGTRWERGDPTFSTVPRQIDSQPSQAAE